MTEPVQDPAEAARVADAPEPEVSAPVEDDDHEAMAGKVLDDPWDDDDQSDWPTEEV